MDNEILSIKTLKFIWSDTNDSYEIVREIQNKVTHFDPIPRVSKSRIVIAFIDKKSDDADIRFVGSRPFEVVSEGEVDLEDLWKLFRYAVKYVKNEIEFEQ